MAGGPTKRRDVEIVLVIDIATFIDGKPQP